MLVCPGREQLRRYLNDDLSAAADQEVLEHVDHCPACQRDAGGIDGGAIRVALAAVIEPTEAPPATWLDRLIAAGSDDDRVERRPHPRRGCAAGDAVASSARTSCCASWAGAGWEWSTLRVTRI